MNKTFNLQDQVQDMYPALRRTVLFSLVGSINALLVNEASRLVDDLGDEFDACEPEDVVRSMLGNDTGPTPPEQRLSDIRLLTALSETWRNDLQLLANDNKQGAFTETLNFMTGKQKERAMVGTGVLKAIGIECSEEDNARSQVMQQARDQQRADALSAKRGHIEWIVEKVFTQFDVGNDGDYFSALSEHRKEALTQKALSALNKAFLQAVDNVKFGRAGDNVLGVSDILIIREWIPKFNAAFVHEDVPEKKVRRVKAAA